MGGRGFAAGGLLPGSSAMLVSQGESGDGGYQGDSYMLDLAQGNWFQRKRSS